MNGGNNKAKDEHAQEVGSRLAQARKEANGEGMTQRELADFLGVSERSVAAYEAGEVIPYRFMRRLEELLGVSAAWLLHGKESDTSATRDYQEQILAELKALRSEISKLRKALEP